MTRKRPCRNKESVILALVNVYKGFLPTMGAGPRTWQGNSLLSDYCQLRDVLALDQGCRVFLTLIEGCSSVQPKLQLGPCHWKQHHFSLTSSQDGCGPTFRSEIKFSAVSDETLLGPFRSQGYCLYLSSSHDGFGPNFQSGIQSNFDSGKVVKLLASLGMRYWQHHYLSQSSFQNT